MDASDQLCTDRFKNTNSIFNFCWENNGLESDKREFVPDLVSTISTLTSETSALCQQGNLGSLAEGQGSRRL